MARSSEHPTGGIYATVDKWKSEALFTGESLLWPDSKIWTTENLELFKTAFGKNPLVGNESFLTKFKRQMEPVQADTVKLAVELLLFYYMFPSTISQWRKRKVLCEVAAWKNVQIPDASDA